MDNVLSVHRIAFRLVTSVLATRIAAPVRARSRAVLRLGPVRCQRLLRPIALVSTVWFAAAVVTVAVAFALHTGLQASTSASRRAAVVSSATSASRTRTAVEGIPIAGYLAQGTVSVTSLRVPLLVAAAMVRHVTRRGLFAIIRTILVASPRLRRIVAVVLAARVASAVSTPSEFLAATD